MALPHPFASLSSPQEMELLVAVYDLTGFAAYSRTRPAREVFEAMREFYALTGRTVTDHGGLILKYIGDAGLCIFPSEIASEAIIALADMKQTTDEWLRRKIPGSRLAVNCHVGSAIVGPLPGYAGETQIDLLGEAVNTAFTLGKKEFLLSPQAFRSLKPEARKRFRKHTPPIVYKLGAAGDARDGD